MADGGGGMDGARAAFEALGAGAEAPPVAERRARLLALRAAVRDAAEDLARAVDADFSGRPRVETMLSEVGLVLSHAAWTARRLARWAAPRRTALPPEFWPARARVERVPLGRVAILGPWNYPVQLTLMPLVAALAGGNRVILKPSEHAPRTAALLASILHRAVPDAVRVVQGGAEVSAAVAALPLDGLFFTGSTETGRRVAVAAAKNLVPTVLELGGKSPAILLEDADLPAAARSIMAGKLFSAGQTCVAPDYLLVPRGREAAVAEALRAAAAALMPDPSAGTALLRPGARERLLGLAEGHRVVPLTADPGAPRMAALAVLDPDPASPLMTEEIFGPVLPILPHDGPDRAAAFVNARPQPLALYVYGPGPACEAVVAATRSGGAVINDAIIHVAAHTLPFGGAGASGMGSYHGEEGFLAFTRPRTVMVAPRWMPAHMGRPPYGPRVERIVRLLLR